MMLRFVRPLMVIIGLAAMFTLLYVEASDTRPRGGGSRGSRTFTPPPATKTAPTAAQPIQRTTTPAQPSTTAAPRAAAPGAAAAPGQAARPGLFNRPGIVGGLMAGLLGAGLIGLLMGQGLFGNLASFAAILGLLLQLALIGGVAFLILRWWQSRSQPQPAMAGIGGQAAPRVSDLPPSPLAGIGMRPATDAPASDQPGADRLTTNHPGTDRPVPMQNSGYGYGASSPTQAPAEPSDEIGLKPEDYDAFERLLGEIQTGFSKEDVATLRERTTPEMMTYLSEDMADNLSRGVASALSGIKLLQGDLAEAWAEGNVEYATVALRYELIDTVVDRKTGAVVEGDPKKPVEATELWTFTRSRRGGIWLLSAIQPIDEDDEGDEDEDENADGNDARR